MSAPFTALVVGPAEHGVTATALAQWELLRTDPGATLVRRGTRPAAAGVLAELAALPPGPLLVHVTDRLFGADADEAADVVVALAGGAGPARPLVVVLHDLPQPSDGPVNHPRRAAAYARVARAAARVVVASQHEERLLAACGVDVRCDVVPLPVPAFPPTGPADPAAALREVAVLGFLYPGKGHEQVLDALDVLPAPVGVTALGRPSDGHEDLVDDLVRRARERGREFRVTGWVPDADLPGLLRSPLLPVAPHAHLSASGSINAWIGAGRRPLVPRSDYVAELLERAPGCVEVYDELAPALRAAWEDPARTWLDGPAGPTLAETVEQVRRVLAEVAGVAR